MNCYTFKIVDLHRHYDLFCLAAARRRHLGLDPLQVHGSTVRVTHAETIRVIDIHCWHVIALEKVVNLRTFFSVLLCIL